MEGYSGGIQFSLYWALTLVGPNQITANRGGVMVSQQLTAMQHTTYARCNE